MSKKAMILALEALRQHGAPHLRHEVAYQSAIKALEEALAKQEQSEPIAWISSGTIFQIKMKERTNKKTIVASLEKTKVIKHPIYMAPL